MPDQANRVAPFQSCVVCSKGDTDTAVGFRGEAEWCIAALSKLGMPLDQAEATFLYFAEQELDSSVGGLVELVDVAAVKRALAAELSDRLGCGHGEAPPAGLATLGMGRAEDAQLAAHSPTSISPTSAAQAARRRRVPPPTLVSPISLLRARHRRAAKRRCRRRRSSRLPRPGRRGSRGCRPG